jgi:hypothetical protein
MNARREQTPIEYFFSDKRPATIDTGEIMIRDRFGKTGSDGGRKWPLAGKMVAENGILRATS